jgi:hypothetical protein
MPTGMAVTVGYDTALAHGRTNRLKRTAKSGCKTDLKKLREFRNIIYLPENFPIVRYFSLREKGSRAVYVSVAVVNAQKNNTRERDAIRSPFRSERACD